MGRLEDRVAIVTGGGDGIGRAVAKAFLKEGARVTIVGRRLEKLEETKRDAAEIARGDPPLLIIRADVSIEADAKRIVAETLSRFSRIDILVNNAGIIGPTEPVENVRTAEWDEVMAINLRGPFMLCREVVPHMLPRDSGCMINIASIAGKIGYPTRSPYAASKWGLIGFSRTLALELGTTNIRVNCVCPGAVMGERLATIIENFARFLKGDEHPRLKAALSHVRASKMLSPEDIASVCVFLASDEASGVSGQEISVAGVTG